MTGPASADFVVLHHIQDAAGWAAALDTEHNWPDGFDLRSFVEDEAHELAVCVWRAPTATSSSRAWTRLSGTWW